MSKLVLHIALVAEGITDYVLIKASLQAILAPREFVLTLLQPEATLPEFGGGWCGVLRWCDVFRKRGIQTLSVDPLLSHYDIIIIHLDTDVTACSYQNCGALMQQLADAQQWPALPFYTPCPPVQKRVDYLETALVHWLGMAQTETDPKRLFCIPAQATDTWLAVATHLPSISECQNDAAEALKQLPKAQRIKKNKREYQHHADSLTQNWAKVCTHCTQAAIFAQRVTALLSTKTTN